MSEPPKSTPGPYEMRPVMGEDDVEIYSSATGQPVATVHSPNWSHKDAPQPETTLHNAALLKAAPQLREALQMILDGKQEQIRATTRERARFLLKEIDIGATKAFLKERNEQRRERDEVLQAQVDEMALQTDGNPDPSQQEDDEEPGHSFSF